MQLANGDHYYSTSAHDVLQMAEGAGNVFEGVRFDSVPAANGGHQIYANYNPYTTDWFFAAATQDMPYACYVRTGDAGFQAASPDGTAADFHAYVNSAGMTQLVTQADASVLGLTQAGYTDTGTVFNTTTVRAFVFNAEGYLVANAANPAVAQLVRQLATQFAATASPGFTDTVEQHYLSRIDLIGVNAHGGTATAADLNALFGTSFGN